MVLPEASKLLRICPSMQDKLVQLGALLPAVHSAVVQALYPAMSPVAGTYLAPHSQ
jgi:hypothetical protein